MEDFLQKLIVTLNDIEVKGKDNLIRLFTCINEAENLLHTLEGNNGEQTN